MKTVLNGIVDHLASLAISLDALESALIRRGLLRTGEISELSGPHVLTVAQLLSTVRAEIAGLPD